MTDNGAGSVLFYSGNGSEYVTVGNESAITITTYETTLNPDNDYLKDVSVITYANDVYNFSINSSVAENPTWINVTVANASNIYNISRDGIYYDNIASGSDSIARYYYSVSGDEWPEHFLEFTWSSDEIWTPNPNTVYLGRVCTFKSDGSMSCAMTQKKILLYQFGWC